MLACETAGTERQDIEDLAVFVSQLAALGMDARVHVQAIPDGLVRNARYDLAPYLFDRPLEPQDRVVLVAAQRLTDERLIGLRRIAGPEPRVVQAVGCFAGRQALIGARAKLSYVFGADPEIVDLAAGAVQESRSGLPVMGVPVRRPSGLPRLLIVAPDLGDLHQARALQALALSTRLRVAVLTDGESKQVWAASYGRGIPFFHYGEVLPLGLARRIDLCVAFASMPTSYRIQTLFANLRVSGAALVDGTTLHQMAAAGDGWIAGPPDLVTMPDFLDERILPNLGAIEAQQQRDGAFGRGAPHALEWLDIPVEQGLARAGAVVQERRTPRQVVFMPTNGIGLGHAQRCSQIATELDRERVEPVFAAFPGCMGLVKTNGFDVMPLVSRSDQHAHSYENDLVNFIRLKALAAEAGAVVFDGGYVFDSVYRTVIEAGVPGIWVRRGLWQSSQEGSVSLDREKAFARVIVPGEVFEELNRPYSQGNRLRPVGPIVPQLYGQDAGERLREQIAQRLGQSYQKLVVSLLGAGVAADRSAQVQALAAMAARRPEVLHLVVAWPSAVLHPAWFAWRNTRIVKTYAAGALLAAADVVVTAAGYNTFLEVLYGAVPAIFIPQMGPLMDDQRARAGAAAERRLAGLVEPNELVALERLLERFLAGEAEAVRGRLAALELPPPGNAAAARVIEEVVA